MYTLVWSRYRYLCIGGNVSSAFWLLPVFAFLYYHFHFKKEVCIKCQIKHKLKCTHSPRQNHSSKCFTPPFLKSITPVVNSFSAIWRFQSQSHSCVNVGSQSYSWLSLSCYKYKWGENVSKIASEWVPVSVLNNIVSKALEMHVSTTTKLNWYNKLE